MLHLAKEKNAIEDGLYSQFFLHSGSSLIVSEIVEMFMLYSWPCWTRRDILLIIYNLNQDGNSPFWG